MDALRLRLEEKESLLSKKSQQISELTEEKSTQHGEITDLKDMLDVKERKVNVLQKKASTIKKMCLIYINASVVLQGGPKKLCPSFPVLFMRCHSGEHAATFILNH